MEFEFGETAQSNAFLDRHPDFYAAFEHLMTLANTCFARASTPQNRAEDVCFSLGHTCREDFLEVLFLGVNGYGPGASKLLRGLFEPAVTLAYIVRQPEKAEQFVHFAAIQEHKLMNAALQVVTEEAFDEGMGDPENTVAKIKERYQRYKTEFIVTQCRDCGRQGTAISWDRDLAAMVHSVGEPYKAYYFGAYALPNLHVHATVASMFDGTETHVRAERRLSDADFALMHATFVFLDVLRKQNELFQLGLDIDTCERLFAAVWAAPPSA
jgi:hypothetical protein